MDLFSDVFSREAKAVIKRLAYQVEHRESISSFSSSVYDTAWLAMVCKSDSDTIWLFPQCFNYLLETQTQDGGWPAYASEMDGILNTMAATIALQMHGKRPDLNGAPFPNDIASRVFKAEKYLRERLQAWDVSSTIHVGFEILVPTLLELLEKDSKKFEFPGRQTLLTLNQSKLSRYRPEALYDERKTTLIHSLEAFVGKIDFDRVAHHLDERGSMMASPSATAAYLVYCSKWDESAENYLRNVVALGSGKGSGGVPSAFPTSIFEITWNTSTLLKAGLSLEALGREEAEKIGTFLQLQLESHKGIVGFDSGLLADADDTAKTILTTNLLGLPTSPDRMIDEFEASNHFCTYKEERNASFSANCNVLDALLHSPHPADYCGPIAKVTRFLCNVWYAARIQDKWNLSEHYSMMLLAQAFVKLLHGWDNGQLLNLPEDLIHDQVPLVLFQILIRTLEKQSSDGSWGLRVPSREITAYAVLTLKTLSSLPWLAHFKFQLQNAIKRGSTFLVMNYSDWDCEEHIWVEKVTYALTPLARTYCLAALCAGTSFSWGQRVASLVTISSEKVVKLSKFFSQLPMFSKDEHWLLEADVAAGCFYLPRLMRVSSDIFPRQEKVNYKYIEYIPFTWISTNRKNGNPLSHNVLWETMIIALLDYQLDEFMETVFGKDEQLKDVGAVKSIVGRLCKFPSHGESMVGEDQSAFTLRAHTNGYVNGHINGLMKGNSGGLGFEALEKVELVLSRCTSYILRHPTVLQSPEHVRRQLHSELATCMLAHIEHEEDNARFAAQKQQQALADSASNSFMQAGIQIAPFSSPRGTYYSWVRTTSADNTHCPFTFLFFSCLAVPKPGDPFFKGVRQHYLSNALCRHLANLCRQYNDYGSVARDQAEGNLNSLNFPEFHEPYLPLEGGDQAEIRDESAMKKDLFFIAEYERECLNNAIDKLNVEITTSDQGLWKSKALRSFVDTVDLYGQIYMARDITNRVK